jgi:hypothetical protein
MKNAHTSIILMYLYLRLTIPISKGFIPNDPWNVNNKQKNETAISAEPPSQALYVSYRA